MKHKLDIDQWVRKEHFHFFKKFEEAFHGVCVDINCTKGLDLCKSLKVSFLIYYLHNALRAMNAIEAMRYRIEGEEVFLYEKVDGSVTIDLENGVFGFSLMDYHPEIMDFAQIVRTEIERVKERKQLFSFEERENVVHISVMPWIHFTSLSHARKFSRLDSNPKISFGKMVNKDKVYSMPLSIHVHHALVDGRDLATYLDLFQHMMDGEA